MTDNHLEKKHLMQIIYNEKFDKSNINVVNN